MGDTFASARAKLAHGEQHRKALEPRIKAYVQSGPCGFVQRNYKPQGRRGPMRVSWFVTELVEPPAEWSLVAGDAIQSLRAALDHAVWAVVVSRKGKRFAESVAPRVAFPISDSSRGFPESRLSDIGLSDKDVAAIRDTQPWMRSADHPRHDPLWLLRALSNVDKHRLLHVIALVAEEAEIRTDPPILDGSSSFPTSGPLRVGAEAVRFEAPQPDGAVAYRADLTIKIGVSFDATPDSGAVAIDLGLRAIRDRVIEALDALGASSARRRS